MFPIHLIDKTLMD